ncbi:MAG TPA: heavy-metal-associated domain-containing protein [Firmicutes bacterium]|jgi:copper chaperone CopZ|nr:heavy-metal-associated domain-containing protein [Bacillota bacterium]
MKIPGEKKAVTETSLVLPEISCAHCRAGLEENLYRLPGVEDVEVSLRQKRVRIRFDPLQTSEETIEKSLAGLGYSIQF